MSIVLQMLLVAAVCLCTPFARAAEATAGGEAVVDNPVQLQPLQQLSVTTDKPLFSSVRRPPPKPVGPVVRQEPPAPPPPPPSLVLLGIVSENGDGRAAIRASDKDNKVVRVRAGDDVSGWKVERIEPRRLVLTLGDRSVDFALFGGAARAAKVAERRISRPKLVMPAD